MLFEGATLKTRLFFTLIVFLTIPVSSQTVQLENWRLPFAKMASEMELLQGSPSGMFWDQIGYGDLFDSSIWPDKELGMRNHWTLEPLFAAGLLHQSEDGSKPGYWHIELLNNVRFRNILFRQTLDVDSRYDDDRDYPAHKGRGVRGRIEEAYLQVDWKYGFFRIGRQNRNWGPFADRSLVLSSYPYSYDALEWQINSSFFEFRHLFAYFGFGTSDAAKATNRYLTAHSLNLMLGEWVTLGITETVVFASENSPPDLRYVNPVSIYTVVNTNQESAGNLMLAFQWNVHPFTKDVSFRGQLVLDDFQVDNERLTDQEPAHWGLDMGLFWRNPFKISFTHLLKAEYTFGSEWLYTVSDINTRKGERYTYEKKSLGLSDNDGQKISAGFSIAGDNYWMMTSELAYSQKGGNTVLSSWRDSEAGHISGLPFDTTYTPQKKIGASLESRFYFKDYADLAITGTAAWVRNRDNIPTTTYEFIPSFGVELSFHFSDFRLFLPQ